MSANARSNTCIALKHRVAAHSRQRGATLFAALMILILLTLLALSVAQVTGLQERMAGLYRTDQQAFQQAEQGLLNLEMTLLADPAVCDEGYLIDLPAAWEDGSVTDGSRIENLNEASAAGGPRINSLAGSAKAGLDRSPGAPNCLVFRLSSLQGDRPSDPVSTAVVQSIFVP